jgi:hypothetical protein
MSKARGKRFGPVGRCIYCRRDDVALTAEHIMPANLGGDIILVDASCGSCQKEINEAIENPCMQRMFRDIRYRKGLGSRRVSKRPKDLAAWVPINWDGVAASLGTPKTTSNWEARRVPYDHHVSIVVLHAFNLPGFLRGVSPGDSGKDYFRKLWRFVIMPKETLITPIYVETEFSEVVFLRLIAKIAHGFAVLRYGIDGFEPFFPHYPYYLGTEPDAPPSLASAYYVRNSRIPGDGSIVERVRIFADLGAPIYTAVVGKYQHDRARLKPYDALDP